MPDKSFVELVEAVEDYRTNFGADDDKPDLVCNDCFDEREDDEEPPL